MNYRHSLILHLKCKWITINFLLQLGWSCNRFELQPWMLFDAFTIYRSLADIEPIEKGICVCEVNNINKLNTKKIYRLIKVDQVVFVLEN